MTCELCGDALQSGDAVTEIDELASEYFMLDTGTTVHTSCFHDSSPPSYLRKLRELDKYNDVYEDEY